MLVLAALATASADTIVLRNDTNYSDTYDTGDSVVWLESPECAIAVLEPDPEDLPMDIHTIQLYFGSSQGNQDGQDSMVDVGIQLLDEGEDPEQRGNWVWGEEAFYITVSSQTINELSMDNVHEGLFPLSLTEGRMAVWICAPDPDTGFEWPMTNAVDTSGIVIDGDSPSEGTWLYWQDRTWELSDLGYEGSWIIRAVAGEGSTTGSEGGDDAGSDGGSGDSGGGSDGGNGGSSGGEGGLDTASGSWDTGDFGDGELSILSITPDGSPFGEAAAIAVVGAGFSSSASLYIGGLPASDVAVTGGNAITAYSPSGLPIGTHDVMVTNPDGTSVTLRQSFEVGNSAGSCGCSGTTVAKPESFIGLTLLGLLGLWRRRNHSSGDRPC